MKTKRKFGPVAEDENTIAFYPERAASDPSARTWRVAKTCTGIGTIGPLAGTFEMFYIVRASTWFYAREWARIMFGTDDVKVERIP